MTMLPRWFLVFFLSLMRCKEVVLGETGSQISESKNMEHGFSQPKLLKQLVKNNKYELLKQETDYEVIRKKRAFLLKNVSKTQIKQLCESFGSQPCTCYYPDHPDVTLFQLDTDETTKTASKVNGTGPSNCRDLQSKDYNLAGFFMVRFKESRVKAIFCDFNQTFDNINKEKEATKSSIKQINEKGTRDEDIKFCNKPGSQQCTFLYSDYPDIPPFNFESNKVTKRNGSCENYVLGPTSCNDLKLIGHVLRGFYIIRRNSNKVKIVYCDFNQELDNGRDSIGINRTLLKNANEASPNNGKQICSNTGSQPCSCYYSNSPNTLQFEISDDEITRNAMDENGPGPKTCEELERIGYFLDGFYMLRFNSKIIKTVYCKFDEQLRKSKNSKNIQSSTITPSTTLSGSLITTTAKKNKLKCDDPNDTVYLLKNGMQDYCLELVNGNSLSLSKCDNFTLGQHWMKFLNLNFYGWILVNIHENKALTAPVKNPGNGRADILLTPYASNSNQQQAWNYDKSKQISSFSLYGSCLASYQAGNNWMARIEFCFPINNYKSWSFVPVKDAYDDIMCGSAR